MRHAVSGEHLEMFGLLQVEIDALISDQLLRTILVDPQRHIEFGEISDIGSRCCKFAALENKKYGKLSMEQLGTENTIQYRFRNFIVLKLYKTVIVFYNS